MLGTESFLVMLLGGNEGFKLSENLDLVFYQREPRAKNIYKYFENSNTVNKILCETCLILIIKIYAGVAVCSFAFSQAAMVITRVRII